MSLNSSGAPAENLLSEKASERERESTCFKVREVNLFLSNLWRGVFTKRSVLTTSSGSLP